MPSSGYTGNLHHLDGRDLELAGGHSLRISGAYDPDALARLIRGLTA